MRGAVAGVAVGDDRRPGGDPDGRVALAERPFVEHAALVVEVVDPFEVHRVRHRPGAGGAPRVLAVPLLVAAGVEDHRRRIVDGGDDIRPRRADRPHRFVRIGARGGRLRLVRERVSRRLPCPHAAIEHRDPLVSEIFEEPERTSRRFVGELAAYDDDVVPPDAGARDLERPHLREGSERGGIGVVGIHSVDAEIARAGDVAVRVPLPAPHVEHDHVIVVEAGSECGRGP